MKRSEAHAWKIEHECPQCGGPLTLEETDRLLSCPFCRVKLYLLTQNYFRYYLPPAGTFSEDLVFAPYWRFKGIIFFCEADRMEYKISDVSSLASSHAFLPASLGFRTQALKLRFLSPDLKARSFERQVPLEKVIQNIKKRLKPAGDLRAKGPIFCELIGETISLIYAPLYIQGNRFHDALLGEPVASMPETFIDDLSPLNQEKDGQVTFVSTLCPRCGWDLLSERDSLVLFCKHCDSVWEASGRELKEIDFGMIPTQEEHACYLPFWRMETRIQGLELESYAELLRMANAPVIIKEEWEESSACFWAPAFKLPPAPFLRSAQALTLSEPKEEFERNLPGTPLYPVNFPSSEAAESIKVTMGHIAVDKRKIFPKPHGIDIQIRKYHLIFLPFILVGNEFVQTQTRFCIQKNVLSLGRNL